MKRSHGPAIFILALITALLFAAPLAQSSLSLQTVWPALADQTMADGPAPYDHMPPLRNKVIDESYNNRSFSATRNETLIVQLKETDPAQSWQYTGQGSFRVIDETVLESYPTLHDFRVKVRGPGDLMFAKVDSRSGNVVERFGVHIVIREPEPERSILPSYPLYDFAAVTPGMLLLWR